MIVFSSNKIHVDEVSEIFNADRLYGFREEEICYIHVFQEIIESSL